MFVLSILLKQLYIYGSFIKIEKGILFVLKNWLKDVMLKELKWILLDGEKVVIYKIIL